MQNNGSHLHITLENIQTGIQHDFANLKELIEFLQTEIEGNLHKPSQQDHRKKSR
jgi:hypothetical protein